MSWLRVAILEGDVPEAAVLMDKWVFVPPDKIRSDLAVDVAER